MKRSFIILTLWNVLRHLKFREFGSKVLYFVGKAMITCFCRLSQTSSCIIDLANDCMLATCIRYSFTQPDKLHFPLQWFHLPMLTDDLSMTANVIGYRPYSKPKQNFKEPKWIIISSKKNERIEGTTCCRGLRNWWITIRLVAEDYKTDG